MRPDGEGGDDAVEGWSVGVWHDALARMVLVDEHMVDGIFEDSELVYFCHEVFQLLREEEVRAGTRQRVLTTGKSSAGISADFPTTPP